MRMFKELNAQVLAKVGPYATQDDIMLAQLQMRKHEIPEEDRQAILFAVNEKMRRAREIDPNYDVTKDPVFGAIAKNIGVDSGPGYFTEGPPKEDFGSPVGRAAYEGVRAFDSGFAAVSNAMTNVGLGVMAMLSDDPYYQDLLGAFQQEAYGEPYVTSNGEFIDRAPRAQSMTNSAYLALRVLNDETVDDLRQRMVKVHDAETVMRANERGDIEDVATGLLIGIGSLGSFVMTGGGAAMGAGVKLVSQGKVGAALLLGAKEGTRSGKVMQFLRTGLGMGIGNGVYHSTLYGRPDGYGKAFLHSVPMGFVFAAAGAMGKATERLLKTRKSMPKFVKDSIAGMVEGFTLSAGSAADLESSLWQFMRDANPDSANRLMKEVLSNTLSFGIWKGMTGKTPAETKRETMQPQPRQPGVFDKIGAKAKQFLERSQERAKIREEAKQPKQEQEAQPTEPFRFELPKKEDFAIGEPETMEARPRTVVPRRRPTKLPDRPPTEVPERAPTEVPERAPSGERVEQAAVQVKPSERAQLGDILDRVSSGVHSVEDRVAVARELADRLEQAQAMRQKLQLQGKPITTEIRREIRAAQGVLKRLRTARIPTEVGDRPGTTVERRQPTKIDPRDSQDWQSPTRVPARGETQVPARGPTKERVPQRRVPFTPEVAEALGKAGIDIAPVSRTGHSIEDRVAVADQIRDRLEKLKTERAGAQVAGRERVKKVDAETKALRAALRQMRVEGSRIESGEPWRKPTTAPDRGPWYETMRLPTRVAPRAPTEPAAGRPRGSIEGLPTWRYRTRSRVDPREATRTPEREASEQIMRRRERAQVEAYDEFIGPRLPQEMNDRPSLTEAQRRVVDYDQLTELERRNVESERRAGKPKSYNQRVEFIKQLEDPLERMDFGELPEDVRQRIIAAPNETVRKMLWFEHISQAGDRRGAERRAGAPEDRPGAVLRPRAAEALRKVLESNPETAKLADIVTTEPRIYTPGEVRLLQDAIQARLDLLRRKEMATQLGAGKKRGEVLRAITREIRQLSEAFRTIGARPTRVTRDAGEEPLLFTAEQARTLNRMLGAGTAQSLAERHLKPLRADIFNRIRDKIEELRALELRSQLAGRKPNVNAARRQIRDLIAVARALEARVEQDVIGEAELENEPAMQGVPRINGMQSIQQVIDQTREAGDFKRMMAEAGGEPEVPAAETADEMLLRADRENEIQPGTHAELGVKAVEASQAHQAMIDLGVLPKPREGQPKSLRLRPELQTEEITDREVPDTRKRDVIAAQEGRQQDPVQVRIRGDIRLIGERTPDGMLGFFMPKEFGIRIRQPRKIVEATHESAHAMDDRLQARGEWRPDGTTDIPDVLYDELAKAADTYPGLRETYEATKAIEEALKTGIDPRSGAPLDQASREQMEFALPRMKDFVMAEGFAEFWARWRLEDPILAEEVPVLWDFMLNDLMARDSTVDFMAMQEYQRAVLANFRDQGAERRVQMMRVMETDDLTDVEKDFQPSETQQVVRSFANSMLDSLADAKREWDRQVKASEMGVDDPIQIPITMNPLKMIEAVAMTAYQQAERAVRVGTFDLFGNTVGEALEPIFEDVVKAARDPAEKRQIMRMFLNYFTAKRAIEVEDWPARKAYEETYAKVFEKLIKEKVDEAEAADEATAAAEAAAEAAKPPETGFAREDTEYVVAKYESSPLAEVFKDAVARVREWTANLMEYAVEGGYLRRSDVNNMLHAYDIYLPMMRAIQSSYGVRTERLSGRGVSEMPGGIKGYEGNDTEIMDPLVMLRAMAYDIFQKTQRYMVMQSLYLSNRVLNPRLRANKQTPLGSLVSEVSRDAEPRTVFIDQIAKELVKHGRFRAAQEDDPTVLEEAKKIAERLIETFGSSTDALTFFFPMTRPTGSRPRIQFRPNVHPKFMEEMGLSDAEQALLKNESRKTLWFELDETVFNTLMSIDAPRTLIDNAPKLFNFIITRPSQWVRSGATVYNPAFAIRNIVRDAMSATVFKTGKAHYNLLNAIGDAFVAAYHQRQSRKGVENEYTQYANVGLEGTSIYGSEFQREHRGSGVALYQEFREGAGQFLRTFQRGIRKWGEVLASPEAWHRFIEFRDVKAKVLREGGTRMDALLEAMYAAKEITTNFTRAGDIARAVNQLVPYYAPNLAGKRKMLRVMSGKEGPEAQKAFWIRAAVNVTGMSLAVAAWNALWGDEDEWREDLPEWQRLNYWNIKIPWTDQIGKIAKPFELGQLFSTMPEAIIDALRYQHGSEFVKQAVFNIQDDFVDSVRNGWKWAAMVPFVETIANHSFFKERPLVPAWMQESRLPEDQYTRYTSGTAKQLGKLFGVSPIKIDNLLSGYTGGWGLDLARGVDQIAGGIRDGDFASILGAPIEAMRLGSFVSGQHELGAFGDSIYAWNSFLTQAAGSGKLSRELEDLRPRVSEMKARVSEIRKRVGDGAEADRQIYELVRPLIDRLGSLEPKLR